MVTPDSPDAPEEMVWAAFFPQSHDPSVDSRFSWDDRHPAFETFYDQHLRKLMLAEGATRYAAKANYHVARIPYLLRLYPDARFLVPVREPAAHVASLLHQHRWFSAGQRAHPRLLSYMRWSQHFEFGRDRRPMHLGDGDRVREILASWEQGDEVRALAMSWDLVYRYLADLIAADDRVRTAVRVVRYEDVGADPAASLRAALEHCQLPEAPQSPTRGPAGSGCHHDPGRVLRGGPGGDRGRNPTTAARWGIDDEGAGRVESFRTGVAAATPVRNDSRPLGTSGSTEQRGHRFRNVFAVLFTFLLLPTGFVRKPE